MMRLRDRLAALRPPVLLAVLLATLAAAGCEAARTSQQFSLSQPVAMAVVCQTPDGADWVAAPLTECPPDATQNRLLAFVANGPTGDVGIIDLTHGGSFDTDPMIPGFTRLFAGGYLVDVTARTDSTRVYLLDTEMPRVVSLDPVTRETESYPLDAIPGRLLYVEDGDALYITFPARHEIARIALEDGLPAATETLSVAGTPYSLALAGDGVLLVGHLEHNYVTVLATDPLEVVRQIGLGPACRDGLDNDDDGLVDREDPGCLAPDDFDETDPANGEPALCANGLDDDNDGLTDLDDPGCRDRSDRTEDSDDMALPDGMDSPFACRNGIDDDGDGLTDYPEDPDCFAAGARFERGLPTPVAEVAADPAGRWAYVAHQGLSAAVVLDLEAGELVNVNALDDSAARKLRRFAGEYAVDFAFNPTAVSLHAAEGATYAYVTDGGGRASRILVEQEGEAVHQADSATEDDDRSTASKPRLFVDGDEVQLGFTPAQGYFNLGPLLVETLDEAANLRRYYGIEFTDDLRAHRNETWTVAYEGALPGTSRLSARLTSSTQVKVVGGNLCELGVLPGDWFVVGQTTDSDCAEFPADQSYNWAITAVGADWIALEPGSGMTLVEGEEQAVPDPAPECFETFVEFQIRPADTYVFVGTRSGFLHEVVEGPDGCEVREDADPAFTGRARAAQVIPGTVPTACPITDTSAAELELHPFSNPIFQEINLFPACTEDQAGTIEIVEPTRGTVWTFAVTSGFSSQTILIGNYPFDQVLLPENSRLYVVDLAGRAIRAIGLDEFELLSAFF